ncbi:MAG: helix-turn-helix domain-containing protein [Pseudomonadales bacterium]
MTERQIRRREDILAAARKLITERGYDGVTMRDLAAESGVAPKTLYHQFENKENLLRTAVEERHRYIYQMIDDEEIEHGIDRLFFIIETVAETTRKNLAYARALTPILSARSSTSFTAVRMNTYRKAISQIAAEDDFVDWIDVDLLADIIYRQVNPLYLSWWYKKVSEAETAGFAKLDTSLILRSVTTGYTHRRTTEMIEEMQRLLDGVTYI